MRDSTQRHGKACVFCRTVSGLFETISTDFRVLLTAKKKLSCSLPIWAARGLPNLDIKLEALVQPHQRQAMESVKRLV